MAWQAQPAAVRGRPRRGAARAPERPALPPWPLVGRDAELARLEQLLAQALAGIPSYAALTGDPGIGKSRLCAELATRAVDDGVRVLVGRCAQDDGAPPLWPWQQVLRGLGHELDAEVGEDEGAEFRTWESIVARVVEAARDGAPGGRPRRPALGRPADAPGAAPAGRAPSSRPGSWCSRPGAATRSRPARWPTWPRRWGVGTPRGWS